MINIAKIDKTVNSKKLFTELILKINLDESADEINQMILMLMEHEFGLPSFKLLAGSDVKWNSEVQSRWADYIDRLNRHEPVQYILGEADFFGRKFRVNPSVLIPRPETEELVHYVKQYNPKRILDIGTGSGCIAISLQLETQAMMVATDVSDGALALAKQNAKQLNAKVKFQKHNVLTHELPFADLDLIVSNPPYIPMREKNAMKLNVLNYEPHVALFVENDDPLIFYKAIVEKSRKTLVAGGKVVVEINENYGADVAAVFRNAGYNNVIVHKDTMQKDRIVSAIV